MEEDFIKTRSTKSILAGLATGIIATVINLVYNYIYRDVTHFSLTISYINITSIIFASILICMVAGLIYYMLVDYAHKSSMLFSILFVVISALAAFAALGVQRTGNIQMEHQFQGLFLGMIIIIGISSAFMIPWLIKHKNWFF
jgi:hypothetical protein